MVAGVAQARSGGRSGGELVFKALEGLLEGEPAGVGVIHTIKVPFQARAERACQGLLDRGLESQHSGGSADGFQSRSEGIIHRHGVPEEPIRGKITRP